MSRKGVIEITSDLSGNTFYAADDGSTSEPLTVTVGTGENAVTYVLDYMPNEKSALTSLLTGDRMPMTDILVSLRPKVTRTVTTDKTRRNDIAAWYANTRTDKPGVLPGRVTVQMEEAYDLHIAARDAAIKADAANAENANAANADNAENAENADNASRTPQSRRSRRAA